jgi:hypothetical protein
MTGEQKYRIGFGRSAWARGGIALLALALAGCGTVQRGPHVAAPSQSRNEPNARTTERLREAIADLYRGDGPAARRKLTALLRRQPGDPTARRLLSEIDTDPRVLLGAESYSYTMREGETLSSIAQRALGDPMLFYALARYNNIAVPSSVVAGQVILIPGHRPAPPAPPPPPQQAPPPRPTPRPTPRPAQPAPGPAVQAPQPRATNPALAARLRGQGLAAMNGGQINRAVALLRQALSLDPDSAVIRNDLGRALRIQSTVRARP